MKLQRSVLALMIVVGAVLAGCAPAALSPAKIVEQYYAAVNAKQLDTAMTFVADEAVFVNPYGKFSGRDEVRASLQLVMNDGITFDLSNFRDTNGRVSYDYTVEINGEAVESGTDGLTIVQAGKITLDATAQTEWAAYVHQAAFGVEAAGFSGPATLPAGWTNINLTNNSQGIQHLQLVKLSDGHTPAELTAALAADGENFPAWAKPAGGPNAPDPGGTTSAVVNLEAGEYAVISVIPDPDGVLGFLKGYVASLTVTEAAGQATVEPPSDISVDLTEFNLAVAGTLTAGPHNLRISNQGLQIHEAYIVKLAPGATAESYINTPLTEVPPGAAVGGITGIVPGAHQYTTLWLEPGDYALFCFFPDAASHAPHFVLGMMQTFTVK